MTEKTQQHKTGKEIFEETFTQILGSSATQAIFFHLKRRTDKDPYEVFLKEPNVFYKECKNILLEGADVLLKCVGESLVEHYGAECSPDEFIELLCTGDEPSKVKIKLMMEKASKASEKNYY